MTESTQFTVISKNTNLVKRMWLRSREDDLFFSRCCTLGNMEFSEENRRNNLLETS